MLYHYNLDSNLIFELISLAMVFFKFATNLLIKECHDLDWTIWSKSSPNQEHSRIQIGEPYKFSYLKSA